VRRQDVFLKQLQRLASAMKVAAQHQEAVRRLSFWCNAPATESLCKHWKSLKASSRGSMRTAAVLAVAACVALLTLAGASAQVQTHHLKLLSLYL